jgi:hypothetical protein
MSAPKVLGQVTSCGECPNYVYYSGGQHRCRLVDETVLDKSIVAPFCPLPDYPSRAIADMQTTILGLRAAEHRGFQLMLLTYVANRLKVNVPAHARGLMVPLKDREVYMGLDRISEVKVWPLEISFSQGKNMFILSPDSSPPLLREKVLQAVDGDELSTWRHHHLAA